MNFSLVDRNLLTWLKWMEFAWECIPPSMSFVLSFLLLLSTDTVVFLPALLFSLQLDLLRHQHPRDLAYYGPEESAWLFFFVCSGVCMSICDSIRFGHLRVLVRMCVVVCVVLRICECGFTCIRKCVWGVSRAVA